MKKTFHKNPSEIIDNMLKDNYGYLVYQEDTIKFLKDICGLSGSDADNIRRAIGRKQKDRLEAALPSILEGYCKMSSKPRNDAEQEAKEFLQIIEDSAEYQFGYNHSLAYCMVGYLCAYLRYYHPLEFTTSYLNNSDNDEDIIAGYELAKKYNIKILPPRFRHSLTKYVLDKENNTIYKGVSSIKFLNSGASDYLYSLKEKEYKTFTDLLAEITQAKDEENRSYINSRQLEILIKLQFFEEFGHNAKLLKIYEAFSALYGRKVISKDKLSSLPVSSKIIAQNAAIETDKQYRDVNIENILYEYEKNVENTNLKFSEQIKFENEILGYVNTTYPDLDKKICLVKDVDNKFTPKIVLYCLQSGKEIECKINKTTFKNKPLKKGMLIKANDFEKKPKWFKTANGFEKSLTETEWALKNYEIVKEEDL
jgi:DNA polymerase-3 subunit alpha